jgi:tetratricopeptide (TPR) repeat protein
MIKNKYIIAIILGFMFFACNKTGKQVEEEKYNEIWSAYKEEKDYSKVISLCSQLELSKYPDVKVILADSYFVTEHGDEALAIFLEVYKEMKVTDVNYSQVINKLGICYADKKDWDNARIYFAKAKEAGHPDAEGNLQLVDIKEKENAEKGNE